MSSYRPGHESADDYNGRHGGYDYHREDSRDRNHNYRDSYDRQDYRAYNSRGGRRRQDSRDRDYNRRYRSRSRSPRGERRYDYRERERDRSQPRNGHNQEGEIQEVEKYDGFDDGNEKCETHGLILIRNLKPSVSKEVLAKSLERICWSEESPSGADPAKLWRVFLIHSRITDRSMGFGFVQFHSRYDAMAAVDKSKELGDKCTVSSQKMFLDYARNAFLPTVMAQKKRIPDKYLIPWYSGEMFYYWREDLYPTELVINASPPAAPAADSSSPPGTAHQDGSMTGAAKKKKPAGGAVNEQFGAWNKSRAELRGSTLDKKGNHKQAVALTPPIERAQTFTIDHPNARACLLCWREFGHSKTLPKHVKYSETHAANLADPAAIAKAWFRMEEFRIDPGKTLQCGAPVQAVVEAKVDEAIKSAPIKGLSFSLKGLANSNKG